MFCFSLPSRSKAYSLFEYSNSNWKVSAVPDNPWPKVVAHDRGGRGGSTFRLKHMVLLNLTGLNLAQNGRKLAEEASFSFFLLF